MLHLEIDVPIQQMPDINLDIEQLNTATIILLVVFVVALAAVCSIARNTIECMACPLRWACSGVICVKNFFHFLCCTNRDEGFSVWQDSDDGL